MGQEIVYCFKCQTRVSGADLKAGNALRFGDRVACSACVPALMEVLSPKEKKELISRVQANPAATSTARIRVLGPRTPRAASTSSSRAPLIAGAAVGAAVLVIVLVVASSGGASKPAPPTPVPAPPPVAESPRLVAARAALNKARQVAAANVEAQITAYTEALKSAEGTPLYPEIEEALRALHEKRRKAVAEELKGLDAKVEDVVREKRFKAAGELLREARAFHAHPEWAREVDRRLGDLERRVDEAYAPLMKRAVEARRRGAAAEAAAAREEVARWELPARLADLDAQLKAIVPAEAEWQPVFDGQTNLCISEYARPGWVVENGALLKKTELAAQSARGFADGQIRIRFDFEGGSGLIYFGVRQGEAGSYRVNVRDHEILERMPHEVIFTCKGADVTATLDGTAVAVNNTGSPSSGRVQFNGQARRFRVLAFDYRPLP